MAENALHSLIRSLSKSQKRYFKVYFNAGSGELNNYLRIFNLIEGMSIYDEDKLRANFSEKEAKNLPSDRNYLYEQLLKSMRAYMSKKNAMMELNGLLQDIQFLFENELHKQCLKRVRKAEKLAHRFEYYGVMIELLEWEIKIYSTIKNKGLSDKVSELYSAKEELLGKQYRLDKLEFYSNRFFHLNRSNEVQSNKDQLDAARHLYEEYKQFAAATENSFYMNIRCMVCEINYATIMQNHRAALNMYTDLLAKWEERPDFIKEKIGRYKRALSNHLKLCINLNESELFMTSLKKLKSYPGRTINEEAEDFQKTLYELLYYLNRFEFDKCKAMIPSLEKGFSKYKSILNTKLAAFYYNLSLVFFMDEEFDEAEQWLNRAFNTTIEVRKDMQKALRWYQVINYYETAAPTTVEYILSSNYRYIVSKGMRTDWDKMLNSFFRKLVNLPEAEQQPFIRETREQVASYISDSSTEQPAGGEEVLVWFVSRSDDISMLQALKERASKAAAS